MEIGKVLKDLSWRYEKRRKRGEDGENLGRKGSGPMVVVGGAMAAAP